jgi:hypothetical protein
MSGMSHGPGFLPRFLTDAYLCDWPLAQSRPETARFQQAEEFCPAPIHVIHVNRGPCLRTRSLVCVFQAGFQDPG